jgi:hypothetical protein
MDCGAGRPSALTCGRAQRATRPGPASGPPGGQPGQGGKAHWPSLISTEISSPITSLPSARRMTQRHSPGSSMHRGPRSNARVRVPVARARVVGANVCQSLSLWRYCSLLSGAASRLPGGRGWRWGRPNPGFHPGACFPGARTRSLIQPSTQAGKQGTCPSSSRRSPTCPHPGVPLPLREGGARWMPH